MADPSNQARGQQASSNNLEDLWGAPPAQGPAPSAQPLTGQARGQQASSNNLEDLWGPPPAQTPQQKAAQTQQAPPAAASSFDWIKQPVIAAIKNAPSGFMQLPDFAMNTAAQRLPYGNLAQRYLADINAGLGRPANAPSNLSGWVQQAIPGAAESARKYPLAAQIGGFGAQAIATAFAPEALGAKIANPFIRGAVQGGQYGAIGGAASELGEEEKQNAPLNPGAIAKSAGIGGATGLALGGPFGMGAQAIIKALAPKVKPYNVSDVTANPAHPLLGTSRNYALTPYEGHIDAEVISPILKAFEGQHGQPRAHQEPPKLITEQALVPPSPRQRIEERQIVPPSPRMRAEAEHAEYIKRSQKNAFGEATPAEPAEPTPPPGGQAPKQPRKILKGKVTKEGTVTSSSWRSFRNQAAEHNTPEAAKLHTLARAKVLLDKYAGMRADAVRQLMEALHIPIGEARRTPTPEGYARINAFLRAHNIPQEFGADKLEAILEKRMETPYAFKSQGVRGRIAEVKRLDRQANRAQKAYDSIKEKSKKHLPEYKTIAVQAKGHTVNIKRYKGTKAYRLEKPDKPGQFKSKTEFDAYKELVKTETAAGQVFPDLSPASLAKGIAKDPELKAQIEKRDAWEWLKNFVTEERGSGPGNPAEIFKGFQDAWKEALARGLTQGIDPQKIAVKTLLTIKASGLDKEITGRWAARLFMNELTQDVIERYNPAFGYKRSTLLASVEKAMLYAGKEPSRDEFRATKGMSLDEIRASLADEIPQLPGWNRDQRRALANAAYLHQKYLADLRAEIARVADMTHDVRWGKLLFGWGRYKRMLEHDLADLGGMQAGGHALDRWLKSLLDKFTTQLYTSTFSGNYSVSAMHGGEALMAFTSHHPVDTAKALKGMVSDDVYRQYGMRMAGRGMQASLAEGEKFAIAKWIDTHVNKPIIDRIESIPNGKTIHQALTAELPERVKEGASAIIAAEHVASEFKYPGGTRQLMEDYLTTAKGGSIPESRQTALAKAEVEVYRLRVKLIMHKTSASPLQERTVFQRNTIGRVFLPMLRAATQQSRVITGFLDDAGQHLGNAAAATLQKDAKKAAKEASKAALDMGRFCYSHCIIATMAGTYALPAYVWWALDQANKPHADMLRHFFLELREHNLAGGREQPELGVKYWPAVEGANAFAPQTMQSIFYHVKTGLHKEPGELPEERRKREDALTKGLVTLVAGTLCDNLADMGAGQIEKIYNHARSAIEGVERVRFFTRPNLLQEIMGERNQQINDPETERHHYDWETAFWDIVLGGESKGKAALHEQAKQEYEREHAQ